MACETAAVAASFAAAVSVAVMGCAAAATAARVVAAVSVTVTVCETSALQLVPPAVTMIATIVAVPVGDWPALGATAPAVTAAFSAVMTKLLSSRLYVNPVVLPADGAFAGLSMPQYACPVTVAVSDGKAFDVPVASCWPPLATTDQDPPVLECRLSASISTNVVEIDAEKVTVTAADPVAVAVPVQISARSTEVLSVNPSARAHPVAGPPDIPETVMLALPMNTETMTRSPIAAGLTVTLVTPPLLLSPPPTGNPAARLIVMGRCSPPSGR